MPDQHQHDPFARVTLPSELHEQLDAEAAAAAREHRVRLLAEIAYEPSPSAEAVAFLKGALQAYLEHGGDLDDHLRVRGPRGSHVTAAALWRQMRDQASCR